MRFLKRMVVGHQQQMPAERDISREVAAVAEAIWPGVPAPAIEARWIYDIRIRRGEIPYRPGMTNVVARVFGEIYRLKRRVEIVITYRYQRFANPAETPDPVKTAVHELVHARHRTLEHGPRFDRVVDAALKRLWAAAA